MKFNLRITIISLFNFLVLSVPLYFRFNTEELFEFNKMILVYFITVLIGTAWVFRMIIEKRMIFKRTPLDYFIILFLFSQLISTLFSIHPYTSIFGYYSRFNGGLLSTLSYILLYYAFVNNFKKQDLKILFLSSFASALLVSAYAILEHYGHSVSCLLAPGSKTFGVDCWIQDVKSRVFATFGQPNWLAAYAISLLPLGVTLSAQKNTPIIRQLFYIVTTIALFLTLIFTQSRSGMLGFFCGGILFLFGIVYLYWNQKKQFIQKIVPRNVFIVFISIVLSAAIFGTSFTPNMLSIFHQEKKKIDTVENSPNATAVNRLDLGGTDSGEIRKIVWQGAINVWKRYPIIGSGTETFAYSYYQDRIREHNDVSEWDFLYNKAHNELINTLATTGLFGLLTYLGLFLGFALTSVKLFLGKSSLSEKLIVLALVSGLINQFVSNFFGFSTVMVNVLLFIFFALVVVLNDDSVAEKLTSEVGSEQYLSLTIVSVFSLILLFKIYSYWYADVAYAVGTVYFNSGEYQTGIEKQLQAIEKSPKEALFYDTLSDNYAKLAVHFATANEATLAAQLLNESLKASNTAITLNSRHLNFYKTRARVLVTLSQIEEPLLDEAKKTLEVARQLSPTDPKLVYTLAVVELTTENSQKGKELLEKAIELKPNYERARWKLSEVLEAEHKYLEAIEQMQYILDNITPENQEAQERINALQKML